VAAELRDPKKQLPLSINTAIPTIIVCYIAANTVYYILLPWKVVSTTDAAAVVSNPHLIPLTSNVLTHHHSPPFQTSSAKSPPT
jgi:L-type amino acid transporter 9